MSYSILNFLPTATITDKTIKIKDTTNTVTYNINVFSIISTTAVNNLVNINSKSATITLDFSTTNEASAALINLQNQIQTLLDNNTQYVPRELENYVAENLAQINQYFVPYEQIITIATNSQYLIYGDFEIAGQVQNYGDVVIINGNLLLDPTGTFSNIGTIDFVVLNNGSTQSGTQSGGVIYTSDQIPFGDGSTPGGTTSTNFLFDGTNLQVKNGNISISNGNTIRFNNISDTNWTMGIIAAEGVLLNSYVINITTGNSSGEGFCITDDSGNYWFELDTNGGVVFKTLQSGIGDNYALVYSNNNGQLFDSENLLFDGTNLLLHSGNFELDNEYYIHFNGSDENWSLGRYVNNLAQIATSSAINIGIAGGVGEGFIIWNIPNEEIWFELRGSDGEVRISNLGGHYGYLISVDNNGILSTTYPNLNFINGTNPTFSVGDITNSGNSNTILLQDLQNEIFINTNTLSVFAGNAGSYPESGWDGQLNLYMENGINPFIQIGDVNDLGNNTNISIQDSESFIGINTGTFVIYSPHSVENFVINNAGNNPNIYMGDISNVGNSTEISLVDENHSIFITSTYLYINNVRYIFPNTQGGASTVLSNDGSGGLTWSSIGGGGSTASGITGSIQTNNGGSFAGYSDFIWDESSKLLNIGNIQIDGNNLLIGVFNENPMINFNAGRLCSGNGASSVDVYNRQLSNGITGEVLTWSDSEGKIQFNNYGQGNFTGSPSYSLAVDSSGNIIEVSSGGGVSGNISGTVSIGQIPYGSALNTLTSSNTFTTNGSEWIIGGGSSQGTNFTVNGSIYSYTFRLAYGASNGYFLQSDNTGNATWTNIGIEADFIVTQTGTNAPTATVVYNGFTGVTFSWARVTQGTYTITSSEPIFATGSTIFQCSAGSAIGSHSGGVIMQYTFVSTSVIQFVSNDTADMQPDDDDITNGCFTIKVF